VGRRVDAGDQAVDDLALAGQAGELQRHLHQPGGEGVGLAGRDAGVTDREAAAVARFVGDLLGQGDVEHG